jgi:pilus assembly protein FimV
MSSDSKTKILREGERYVQQGKISSAINEYLKIIKDEPEDVLILNTLGDLYLRQSRVSEANRLFLRVAEKYANDSFLQKAIAVYKKILRSNPNDLEVNMLLASLYERQGMNVDARNQYLLIGDLCAGDGKTKESLDAFEKAVVIDPLNAALQLKLAETFLAEDSKEKAYLMFSGAARAQMKSGDVAGAMASFRRALALNWTSAEAMKGFLESSLNSGDLQSALAQIGDCVQEFPEDPGLQILLGRVYEASGDLNRAEQCFQNVVRSDDSHYSHILKLSQRFLESDNPDRAFQCLQSIAPVLICRRETEILEDAYSLILARYPEHLETMERLTELLSVNNRDNRYQDSVLRLSDLYLKLDKSREALECIEKMLDVKPDDRTSLQKHRELYAKVHPGIPYHPPQGVMDARTGTPSKLDLSSSAASLPGRGEGGTAPSIVEIDLLLNYGLKEKALQLLCSLEESAPQDKEVRTRLRALYEESSDLRRAAEQCVLLSALHQNEGDAAAARKLLGNAQSLAPEWANSGLDMRAFAREHGILLETSRLEGADAMSNTAPEVDLSGDLSEIFFQAAPGDNLPASGPLEGHLASGPDVMAEEYPQEIPRSQAPESVDEQLQEVDFYIRLGFRDEARAKLEEVAAAFPGHPELAARFSQLGMAPAASAPAIALAPPASPVEAASLPIHDAALELVFSAEPGNLSENFPAADAGYVHDALASSTGQFGENTWFETSEDQAIEIPALNGGFILPPMEAPAPKTDAAIEQNADASANSMFADLIAEVNSLTNQEIQREDYETHFNLGIAYQEMGLVDDAIREFQSSVKALDASKSPKEIIQCCGRLSSCYLEKGMPKSAIRWCQTAMGVKEISAHESTALRYDMGVAYVTAGESERALECFGMVFGVDPGYRDVAQRIDGLKIGMARHVP